MTSQLAIANRALGALGARRISALTEKDKGAIAIAANWDSCRDAELAEHAWRFAVTRQTLEASATPPAWGYARAFPLRPDTLRVLTIGDVGVVDERLIGVTLRASHSYDRDSAAYEMFDNEIHTDEAAPLKVEYVRRVAETRLYHANFVEALVYRLARDCCIEITDSKSLFDRMDAMHQKAMKQAKRVNALWRPARRPRVSNFLAARQLG